MPSNQTPNYGLNQWIRSDQVKMEDFNADNLKTDAAIKAQADALTALTGRAARLGNCQIWSTSYVGAERTSVTFPKKPSLVVIGTNLAYMAVVFPCDAEVNYLQSLHKFTWNGNTLTWSSGNLCRPGYTYFIVAFWPMD